MTVHQFYTRDEYEESDMIDLEHINITVKCDECGFEYVTSDDKETMPCPKCGAEVKVNPKH